MPANAASGESSAYYLQPRLDLQALIVPRGKRILDVGCAGGELGGALKEAGAEEVVGIEREAAVADVARRKLDAVVVGDVEDGTVGCAEASFDYVLFADVLEHLRDPWSVLASFRRFLKPDGRVVASIPNVRFYTVVAELVFNRWGYRDRGILDRGHLRFFTLPTIREMFEGAGYTIERVERQYRLFEDQRGLGRIGALSSRLFCRFVAPFVLRDAFTFQYLILARKSG